MTIWYFDCPGKVDIVGVPHLDYDGDRAFFLDHSRKGPERLKVLGLFKVTPISVEGRVADPNPRIVVAKPDSVRSVDGIRHLSRVGILALNEA
jgi:hypothetical protein